MVIALFLERLYPELNIDFRAVSEFIQCLYSTCKSNNIIILQEWLYDDIIYWVRDIHNRGNLLPETFLSFHHFTILHFWKAVLLNSD